MLQEQVEISRISFRIGTYQRWVDWVKRWNRSIC